MAPVQVEILSTLNDRELSMNDLVNEVRGKSEASATTVKAAVLPLISGDFIEMTADRKLRVHKK
jgi:hypothetical protein